MSAPAFQAAEAAIATAFRDGWAVSGALRTPVDWPGGAGFAPPQGAAWARLSILWGEGRVVAVGPPTPRRWEGRAVVQVFTPLGAGNGPNTALCDAAAAIFAGRRLAPASGWVRFYGAPSITVVGPDAGRWWQQNVVARFQRGQE